MSVINFSDNAAMFLLLNILGHDPIHDYNDYNSNRWSKCQRYLQQMGQMIGGAPTKTTTTPAPESKVKSSPSLKQKADWFKGKIGKKLGRRGRGRGPNGISRIVIMDALNKKIEEEKKQQSGNKSLFLENYFIHIRNQILLKAMHCIFFKLKENVQKDYGDAEMQTDATDLPPAGSSMDTDGATALPPSPPPAGMLIDIDDNAGAVIEIVDEIPILSIFLINDNECGNYDDFELGDDELDMPDQHEEDERIVHNENTRRIQSEIIELITFDFFIFCEYCLSLENFRNMHHLIECLNNYLLSTRIETIVAESVSDEKLNLNIHYGDGYNDGNDDSYDQGYEDGYNDAVQFVRESNGDGDGDGDGGGYGDGDGDGDGDGNGDGDGDGDGDGGGYGDGGGGGGDDEEDNGDQDEWETVGDDEHYNEGNAHGIKNAYTCGYTRGYSEGYGEMEGGFKSKKMTGGAAVKLLPTDDDEFIAAINGYWTTLQTDPIFINFKDDVFVMAYPNYDAKRSEIIDSICNIAFAKGMPVFSIPYLRANMERLYPRQLKRPPRQPSNLPDRIKEAIFFSTIESQKRKNEDALKDLAATKKQERDEAAAAAGALTSDEKKGVSDFMKFIARFVLWAMQICDQIGEPITNLIVAAADPLLLKQIDCLKAVAEWGPTLANKDIDTRLITNFFNFYSQNGNIFKEDDANACKPATPTVYKKYIINNAASIGSLQNKVFCPTSSIVDAMTSTCTWSTSADQGREAGNLDYTIAGAAEEAGFSYQGKTTFIGNPVPNQPLIIAAPGTTDYIESILVATLPNGIVIRGEKTIHIPTSTELTAHVALKHTLVVVIEKMYALTTATPTFFTAPTPPGAAPWGIWGRLFDYGVTEANNQFFKDLFAELLFKGRGDLDQEINAAIKWGGYIGNPRNIQYGPLIVQHDLFGEAMRYFVANDRPSACRFMFMLLNAPLEQVNRLAFGGYYSDRKRVLVKHPLLGPGCRIQLQAQVAAGGSRKRKSIMNKKTKKHHNRKKQTKRYITKTNRKTRKNKYRKH